MAVKDDLIQLGMKKEEIECRSNTSDLYVKKTPISEAYFKNYEFKSNVTVFHSQIDKELWYDVAFGDWEGFIQEKETQADNLKDLISKRKQTTNS